MSSTKKKIKDRNSTKRTDVLDDVSRETMQKEEAIRLEQQKKKADLDAVRKKGGITDDDPFDFNNPPLKELYSNFRSSGLSRTESSFNALYLWCYDNYYSSGVPIKTKYKNIYAHPTAWFHNTHHMWKHNKWSVAVKFLELFPAAARKSADIKQQRSKAKENFWKTLEYSHMSAKKALDLCVSLMLVTGIAVVIALWTNKIGEFKMIPALSLYIDGEYVGEVLSVADAESAKSSIEDTYSINLGSSYKLDCTIEYKASRIAKGSNLTHARLSRAFGDMARKQMKQGYGLYYHDVLVAVSENKQWIESSMDESLWQRLSEDLKNDDSIEKISYLNFTIREGTYPTDQFFTHNEIRRVFSLPTLEEKAAAELLESTQQKPETESSEQLNIPITTTTTLLPVESNDAGTTSDTSSDDKGQLIHQITIETVVAKTETVNETIPFSTECVGYDETLMETRQTIVSDGVNGSKTATYHVEYVNNVEISRRLINEVVITQPIPQQVIRGTRPMTEEEKLKKSTGTYIYPSQGEMSSKHGWRTWGNYNEFHRGIDLRSDKGLVLIASDGGEVIQATDKGDGYGLCILIKHDDGTITRYAHCSKLHVVEGQRVAQGEYIADMGATGMVTGVHIHFEIIKDGVAVDPLQYLIPRE